MPFQPGHSKTGGRKPGTPNVLTKELRSILKQVIQSELETLPARISAMDENQRISILIKLLPYALPNLDRIHYSENEPIEFV